MIIPFLNFHGRCEEAVSYYGSLFEFTPQFLRFSMSLDRGFDVPESYGNKIMFSLFQIAGNTIYATDHYPGLSSVEGQTLSLNLIADKTTLESIYQKLIPEGQSGMTFQKTLWSGWYASLIDKYGVVWQFSLNE